MWRQAQGTVPLVKPRFVHRNCFSVDGRPALPSLSTGTSFPWMAVLSCPVYPPEQPFRGWPSGLARFVHRNCLSVDGRPALPSLSTGTSFPWMAVLSCPVYPPEQPFRGWPSGLARFVHRNCLSVDGRPALPSLSTRTAFPVDEGRGEYKKNERRRIPRGLSL